MMPQGPASRFGSALHRALQEKGKKQASLARELCVDAGQVSRWVNGRTTPSLAQVRRIEEILGTNLPEALASSEYELFIASPVGGLATEKVEDHLIAVAKV